MRQPGFTLVELVVVIAILAILSVVAIPRFFDQGRFDRYAAVDQLINQGRFAQQQAFARTGDGLAVQWVLNPTTAELRVEQIDETSSCAIATASCEQLRLADPSRVLSCISLTASNRFVYPETVVRFDSLGGVVTTTSLGCDASLVAGRFSLDLDADTQDDFCIETLGLAHDQAC